MRRTLWGILGDGFPQAWQLALPNLRVPMNKNKVLMYRRRHEIDSRVALIAVSRAGVSIS